MEFTYTEKNGSIPIEQWLVTEIKEHAKKKFGVVLNVEVKKDENEDSEEASA